MTDEKWKLVEKVVFKLEKAISPEARIEHNIFLPDLNGDTDDRQIDVAIWSGKPPRETLSIVEVQDRETKVDINMFSGWLEKMKDVGAQHLICVSTKGFPASVVNKARKRGPSVRLIHFNEINQKSCSLDFIDNTMVTCTIDPTRIENSIIDFFVTSNTPIKTKHQINSKQDIDFISDQEIFLYNGIAISINNIITMFAVQFAPALKENNNLISIDTSELHGVLEYNGKFRALCQVRFAACFNCKKTILPITFYEYRRIDLNHTEAWLMEATFESNDQEEKIKIALIPDQMTSYKWEILEWPPSLQKGVNRIVIHNE